MALTSTRPASNPVEFAVSTADATPALLSVRVGAETFDRVQVTPGALLAGDGTTAPNVGVKPSGVGVFTGAGGVVTQATDRSTTVVLSKLSGQITTHNASLAAGAEAEFTVTNTLVAATDVIILNITPGGTGTPFAYVSTVAAGSFKITVTNLHASTADTSADVINFVVLKGAAS